MLRSPLTIDGSILEGGGQLIRLSLSLSCVLEISINVHSIRARRPKPGLSAQHLEGARLACVISGGALRFAEMLSTAFEFTCGPRYVLPSYIADSKTAGSVTLIIQVALPALVLAGAAGSADQISLTVKGGTNVPFSPAIDHTAQVLFPILARLGYDVTLSRMSRGFFPKGGGVAEVKVVPKSRSELRGLVMTDQGRILNVRGIAYGIGGLATPNLVSALATSAKSTFATWSVDVSIIADNGGDNGRDSTLGLEVWATTDTDCILSCNVFRSIRGQRGSGFDMEGMLVELIDGFRALLASGACLDEHTADQLVVYLALCPAASQITCAPRTSCSSLHLETAVHICNTFYGFQRLRIAEYQIGGCRLLTCDALE